MAKRLPRTPNQLLWAMREDLQPRKLLPWTKTKTAKCLRRLYGSYSERKHVGRLVLRARRLGKRRGPKQGQPNVLVTRHLIGKRNG